MTTSITRTRPRASGGGSSRSVNDFVIKFANINGSGSASANQMFATALFRMGVPVATRNIFPSNIQGLPTWYEVRVSEKGYLGRREGVDIMVAMNAETYPEDAASLRPGGFLFFDSSKPFARELIRDDVTMLGVPISQLLVNEFEDPKQRQLFKNIVYVGALSVLLDMDFSVLTDMVAKQYAGKEKLLRPNVRALEIGRDYARDYLSCPLPMTVRAANAVGDRIMVDGNTACGLGAVYGGATVCAWYPITPSTSLAEAFERYANQLRIDPKTKRKKFAIIQAEDELSSIGIVIGAAWNGARAFTATSGPGVSLMQEFIGLAYFAEIPAVIVDVQRAGPSTGMPTRTQQADLMSAAYASHGDTKHVVLLPATPKECFDFTAQSLDLADRLQTPVLLLTDLELGMNEWLSEPFSWDENRRYDRGKVLTEDELEQGAFGRRVQRPSEDGTRNADKVWGRYVDIDGDGIGYRTYPGTHASKGSFFTRGTSRDEYARYTEAPEAYIENVDRLLAKWETAKTLVPVPEVLRANKHTRYGILYYGTSATPMQEALDILGDDGIVLNGLRVRAFPFTDAVEAFIDEHEYVFVVDQNRDGQMRTLLINELDTNPAKLGSVRYYGGLSISADHIVRQITEYFVANKLSRITEVAR